MMAMAGPLEFIWFNQVAADIIRLGWAMGMSDWKTWSGVGETTLQKPKESIETSHPRYDDRSQQCLQMSNWVSVYCTVYTVGQILLGLRFVSLTRSPVESLEEEIRITRPHILLSNVESLTSPDIQRRISKLQISYIAVDEAQVLGPLQMA